MTMPQLMFTSTRWRHRFIRKPYEIENHFIVKGTSYHSEPKFITQGRVDHNLTTQFAKLMNSETVSPPK
jgi:hypothetical protein